MLRRSVYLLTGFVSQGVVWTVWLVSKGAGWMVSFVALGVDRTVGLANGARGTLGRLWDAAGVEQVVAVAAELPENTWGSLRSYAERLGSTARCRTRYRRIARRLGSRYRQLRRAGRAFGGS